MKHKPIIGVTLDWEDTPTYSKMCNWYALRTNYTSSVAKHNAAPITIPYEIEAVDDYINIIDGLIVTGGDYDLDPSYYGEDKKSDTRIIRNNRVEFEIKLIKAALAKNIPILAICAGEQLLTAMYGGTLHQDIKIYNPKALEHEQIHLGIHMSKTSHKISVVPNSLLHSIVKQDTIEVNSSHHQAVKSVGPEMTISAISSEDNIIEAVELPSHPFVLGIEWHPEYEATEYDTLIIKAFIKAASK